MKKMLKKETKYIKLKQYKQLTTVPKSPLRGDLGGLLIL